MNFLLVNFQIFHYGFSFLNNNLPSLPWGEIRNTNRCLAQHRGHKLARLVHGKRNHAVYGNLDYTRHDRRPCYTRKYGKKVEGQTQQQSYMFAIRIYLVKRLDLYPRVQVFLPRTHLSVRKFSCLKC